MREERTKNFVNTVIFVARIFSGLKDKFLARKLYDKLSDFISAYVAQKGFNNINVAKSDYIVQRRNVAQYSQTLLTSIDALLELLDYLEHSKAVAITPLLYARRNLFVLKLQAVRTIEEPNVVEKEKSSSRAQVEGKEVSPATSKTKKEINAGGNKEKIFSYIKRSPNSRTKDIIYEFSILSERTVKRNLQELVSEGLVKKSSKDKAVYYHAT